MDVNCEMHCTMKEWTVTKQKLLSKAIKLIQMIPNKYINPALAKQLLLSQTPQRQSWYHRMA